MIVDLKFTSLLFVFFAAVVACFGWHVGVALLVQLGHIAARLLRRLRSS